MKEKIVFFGTSEIAIPALNNLIKNNFKIEAVVTQPDKPQGRKKELLPSPIKKIALKNNLKIIQPEKLSLEDLKNLNLDIGILVSYGQILKPEILSAFKHNILNIHPSLLPKYRGPSPIQATLLNADEKIGVTLMKLDEKMDAGPIICQQTLKIEKDDDYLSLTQKSSELGAKLVIDNLEKYINKKIIPKNQDENLATYCKIIKKQDGEIKLTDDPKKIIQKLKAYTPWPGVYFFHKNKRYKIKKAHLDEAYNLNINIIQPEGKKEMLWQEFKRGYSASLPGLFSSIKS